MTFYIIYQCYSNLTIEPTQILKRFASKKKKKKSSLLAKKYLFPLCPSPWGRAAVLTKKSLLIFCNIVSLFNGRSTSNHLGKRRLKKNQGDKETNRQTWGHTEGIRPGVRLGKKHFFVNSEIWGMQIQRKKRVNYDKFEIMTRHCKSNIKPKSILFLPFYRCNMILPCFLHSINIFCIINRL